MDYAPKEGSGVLFKNNRKDAPNQPDYTGNIFIGGVKKRIAAWTKKDKNGNPFFSLQVSDFQQQAQDTRHPAAENWGKNIQEDVPF